MSTPSAIPLIYIAGPFRGPTPLDVRRNVEAARDLGLRVAQCGGYPMIPHTMTAEFDKQLTDEFWLDGTMEMLKRCDAICLHYRWRQSTGACTEAAWAYDHDLPVFFGIEPIALMRSHGDDNIGTTLQAWIEARRR